MWRDEGGGVYVDLIIFILWRYSLLSVGTITLKYSRVFMVGISV